MKASKQVSIVLAASVLALGVATLAPQQVDASYGYKYTDSQRPPVSTPTGYVNPSMGSTVTVTDPAPTTSTNKLTTPVTSNNNVTIESVNTANVAPKYSDYNDIAAYSLAVADYFMAKNKKVPYGLYTLRLYLMGAQSMGTFCCMSIYELAI